MFTSGHSVKSNCPGELICDRIPSNQKRNRSCLSFSIDPWAACRIRNIAGCACTGNAGNVFPRRRLQRKPLVSDPGMHHGTCVTHMPWCMSGSLASGGGENDPGIPGACAPAIFRIWQEAHGSDSRLIQSGWHRACVMASGLTAN